MREAEGANAERIVAWSLFRSANIKKMARNQRREEEHVLRSASDISEVITRWMELFARVAQAAGTDDIMKRTSVGKICANSRNLETGQERRKGYIFRNYGIRIHGSRPLF
jgi:hypothetical protein